MCPSLGSKMQDKYLVFFRGYLSCSLDPRFGHISLGCRGSCGKSCAPCARQGAPTAGQKVSRLPGAGRGIKGKLPRSPRYGLFLVWGCRRPRCTNSGAFGGLWGAVRGHIVELEGPRGRFGTGNSGCMCRVTVEGPVPAPPPPPRASDSTVAAGNGRHKCRTSISKSAN